MPFWLNESRLSLALRQFSTFHRALGTFVCCLFTASAWLFLFYLPANKKYNQQLTLHDDMASQLLSLSTKSVQLEQMSLTRHQKEQEVGESVSSFFTMQGAITKLLHIVEKHNLTCRRIGPASEKQKTFFTESDLALSIEGTFHTLIPFFEDIEQLRHQVAIVSCTLSRLKKRKLKGSLTVRLVEISESSESVRT